MGAARYLVSLSHELLVAAVKPQRCKPGLEKLQSRVARLREPNETLERGIIGSMGTEPLPQPFLRTDASGHLLERKVYLVWLAGPRAGERIYVNRALVVGSGEDADVVVDETTLSRRHVRLTPHAQGLEIVDLGSTNGTYVGGVRIQHAMLETESTVVLGRLRARVEVGESPARSEALLKFGPLATANAKLQALFGIAARVATGQMPVLIEGETGVGKEQLAKAIHVASRRPGPFVVVDCRSLTEQLAESELFGHVKGAFTGASANRLGLFEEAGQGTLLLDEVAQLAPSLQPRLLRALEGKTFRRVGDSHERPMTARLITTSTEPLETCVRERRLREDLYFRLAVVSLTLPPLRERLEDFEALMRQFTPAGAVEPQWPAALVCELKSFAWPGNIRQLKAFIERAFALSPAPHELSLEALRPFLQSAQEHGEPERQRVEAALAKHGGNQTLAARELGMARGTLLSRMDEFGIPRPRKGR